MPPPLDWGLISTFASFIRYSDFGFRPQSRQPLLLLVQLQFPRIALGFLGVENGLISMGKGSLSLILLPIDSATLTYNNIIPSHAFNSHSYAYSYDLRYPAPHNLLLLLQLIYVASPPLDPRMRELSLQNLKRTLGSHKSMEIHAYLLLDTWHGLASHSSPRM